MLKDLLEHRHEVEEEVGDLGKVVEVGQDETASTSAVAPDEKSGGVRVAVNEVEGVEPESGWANEGTTPPLSSKAEGKRKVRRRAHASYELSGTSDSPQPRIRIIFSSASSNSGSSSSSDPDDPRSHVLSRHPSANSDETDPSPVASTRFEEVSSESESNEQPGGADMRREISADSISSAGSVEVFEGAGPKEMHLLKRMYGIHVPGHRESGESEEEAERDQKWLGMDPVTTKVRHFTEELNERKSHSRRNSDETVKWVAGGLKNCAPGHCEGPKCYEEGVHPVEDKTGVDAGGEADDEDESTHTSDAPKVRRRHHHHRTHRREVFIPLNIDSEFLTLLAQALNSLAILQTAQKTTFASSVALLAREVSLVSSPSRPRSDLYIWREIFSLWVEAQIFESERERDRGERTVEDAELKLGWFVDQVAVRGLAKKMRHKESRVALEKFIKLNVELLDMKRFQMANEEAARKIVGLLIRSVERELTGSQLKKHDKRTALTASLGFPQFIAAASSLSVAASASAGDSSVSPIATVSRALHLPGFPSLPHILLATFTNTLLPIIPSLEDYECTICGDVAFKPIRLECGHKFCVRCLVKMQKRGQDACPQCRSAVVLRANGSTSLRSTGRGADKVF